MSSTFLVLQLTGLCGSLLEVDTGGLLSLLKTNNNNNINNILILVPRVIIWLDN